MNYDLKMKEQLSNVKEGSTLLLHACCAPCSSTVLERLGDFFHITIFYYNPNISEESEYQKRLSELKKFIASFSTKYPIHLIEGRYDPGDFFAISKGLEKEKERGKRCYCCYQLRLEETAKVAEEKKFDYFTTTLSISPYKNANWINEIGKDLENHYQVYFLYSDFKKNDGYHRSIELSHLYHL